MTRKALVVGATGLVGGAIVDALLADEGLAEVRALVRRPLEGRSQRSKLRELIADFDALDAHPDWFHVDQVFCAIGTTIRKAGSREAFRRVDFDYPFAVARLAHAQGARHFLLVSAVGADAGSRIFYSRVKGELEDAVLAVGFASVTIARPSVLTGPREERRVGELVMKRLAHLLPAAWKPVHARRVAVALVRAARAEKPGVEIVGNAALRAQRGDA